MAFLKVTDGKIKNRRNTTKGNKEIKRRAKGIVYLIKCVLDNGDTVFKIGITTRRSINDRLMENVLAHFIAYRYIPRTTVKKFSKTEYYTEVEAYLHRVFKDRQYKFNKPFTGHSEYFLVNEDELIEMYDRVMTDPLGYVEPTKSTLDKQEQLRNINIGSSINDIDPGVTIC